MGGGWLGEWIIGLVIEWMSVWISEWRDVLQQLRAYWASKSESQEHRSRNLMTGVTS